MSIRHGLLALLDHEPMYGYQLRTEFERATGSTWPLNVGQVYSTLARLERDGLVQGQGEDGEGRTRYAITPAGSGALRGWFDQPVEQANRPRDELAIKLALAVTVSGVDVAAVVQTQRTATLRGLQELTRLKAEQQESNRGRPGVAAAEPRAADLSWSLVLESLRFAADAELRWLDHCEASVLRAVRAPSATRHPQQAPQPTADAATSDRSLR